MKERYRIQPRATACEANIIKGEHYRFTILTSSLVRMEYDEKGVFTDAPTQSVFYRDFPIVEFTVEETETQLRIDTGRLLIEYDKGPFCSTGLYIHLKSRESEQGLASGWYYGEVPQQLGGTARTLDTVDGACPLEPGLISRKGYALLDDSCSLLLQKDGFVEPRRAGCIDLYFFGYGHAYRECMHDFYTLTGPVPMLPRFVFGNWWSRYYVYSEQTYLALMDRFEQEGIPFSVAVIDMDWHLTKIDPKYGSGWTGYTWNRDLFPNPVCFLENLHRRGMKTTLNLHPAEGIGAHEDVYPEMAQAMGIDPKSEQTVLCDVTDSDYLENYFDCVLHPLEDQGVDFWWIDWQQGTRTKLAGLDPLWMWNHYHFLDSAREGHRPLTFSRYAGPGSHRYPIGFSGDTVITWESLDFQPYFTTTAANIGYGWWSHDIGGHMHGYKNDELEVRWYQYGVFSPINRLHSSASPFNGKEPWRFGREACEIMKKFLRLRHKLVPYLYTMNYRAWHDGEVLCEPMYYADPEAPEAYTVPNQYRFGTQLMAAPVTTPRISSLNLSRTDVWLPQGQWFDVFARRPYRGGRKMHMYRTLDTLPLFAPAGAIVPMTQETSGKQAAENPNSLEIHVYPGANGTFMLYEDDNTSVAYQNGICAYTPMDFNWEARRFTVHCVVGEHDLLPQQRSYTFIFEAVDAQTAEVSVNSQPVEAVLDYTPNTRSLSVTVMNVTPDEELTVYLPKNCQVAPPEIRQEVFELLNAMEIEFSVKDQLYRIVCSEDPLCVVLSRIYQMEIQEDLKNVLLELLTA